MSNEPFLAERSRQMFICDNVRCFFTGIVEGGFKTFVLLIAIRIFHAPNVCKATLASIGFAGLLFAPITVNVASKLTSIPATRICMFYFILTACLLVISTYTHSFGGYFITIALARILFKQYIPLMVDVYGYNYSKNERGYKLSCVLMVLPIATALFSPIGGFILDSGLENYRLILLIIALASIGVAYAFYKMPSRPIPLQEDSSLLSNVKVIFRDKLFFTILILMTLTGVANQMTFPLRAEYLANEKYGINISNISTTLIITTIPYSCRMLSSIFWGKLFDRLSVMRMRVIVNLFLLLEFIFFFNSTSVFMLSLSAVFMGLGYGGGEVLWCLWVTKIVDRDKLSQYMSADTAFVGMRSFVSPFIGYLLLGCGCSFSCIGNIAALLVLISSIGCFLIRKHARFSKNYD
ncbi:MAG: MFS transporter [Puniceicoccales bacterium]|nr:MFS transporter [Puniceicoccales bacterium]